MLLFLPAQSVVNFFLWLGHIVINIFSSSVATKYPTLFRIRSTSLTFSSPVRCCPELTPRLSRYAVTSSLHANRGTICNPVPSKLQAESRELKEQVKVTFILQTATSADLDQCTAGLIRRSQVTGHRSQVAGHRSQVTGHRSQVAVPKSRSHRDVNL